MDTKGRRGFVWLVIALVVIIVLSVGVYFWNHKTRVNSVSLPPQPAGASVQSSTIQALNSTSTIGALASAVPVATQKISWLGNGLIGLVPTSTTFGDVNGWATEVKGAEPFDAVISKVTEHISPCNSNTDDCYGARNDPTIKFNNQIITTDRIDYTPDSEWVGNTYSIFTESQDNGGGLKQDFTLMRDSGSNKKIIILAHYSRAFCCDASTEDDYKIIIADLNTMITKVYNLSDLVTALP